MHYPRIRTLLCDGGAVRGVAAAYLIVIESHDLQGALRLVTGETLDLGSGPGCDAFREVHGVLSQFARGSVWTTASEGQNLNHKVWRLEMLDDLFSLSSRVVVHKHTRINLIQS